MGSFNAVCTVSNLPIEAGTPVRFLALARSRFHGDGNDHVCYVGGRWQLYGVPIKGQYNSYGSVEKLEESYTTKLFFEALRRGSIEKGVGDNQSHDAEVRSDMSPEKWLNALWEGRIHVLDQRPWTGKWDPAEHQPAVGIPSLLRIETLLKDTGFHVSDGDGADGYIIDEVNTGFIRVRYGRHHKDSSDLEKILPIFHARGYAAMITAGTGTYSNHSEILVAALPPTDPEVFFRSDGVGPAQDHNAPRPVSQAMIREDVWQILRSTPMRDWDGTITRTNEDIRKLALEAVEAELAFQAQKSSMTTEELLERAVRRDRDLGHYQDTFQSYLGGHEGVSGFTLRSAFRLGLSMTENTEDLKAFVLDLADTLYVEWIYSSLRGQWHPTSNGGQDAQWDHHREFHLKLSEIKGRWEEDEEDDEPNTEEPQTDNDGDDEDEP